MIYRSLLAALLVLASASSAHARIYSFTWGAWTTGHSTQDGSPVAFGHTGGYGLISVAPSSVEAGGIELTFTGSGGNGHAIFSPPGTSTDRAQGIVWFPSRTDMATEYSSPASIKWYGDFTDPDKFIIDATFNSQGGSLRFSGAAGPIKPVLTTLLYNQNVTGTVNVGMAAGLANVPLAYELWIDSTQIYGQTITAGTASTAWDTRTVSSGAHQVSFVVRDPASGTLIDSITSPVNVGNAPSQLAAAITSPAPNSTVTGTVTVAMSVTGATAGTTTFTLWLDGAQLFTGATSGTSMTYSWNTAGASAGGHTLKLDVKDPSGRTATTSQSVTVGSTTGGLKVIFTSPAEGATVGGTVWVDVWVEGASGTSNTFTLAVDGTSVATQTISGAHATLAFDSRKFANGGHTMTATGKDATGKTGSANRSIKTQN